MNLKNCQNPFSFNSGKSPYQNNYYDFAIFSETKKTKTKKLYEWGQIFQTKKIYKVRWLKMTKKKNSISRTI